MRLTRSVLVRTGIDEAWAFLTDESNAPRWDRSIRHAERVTQGPLAVGSVVRTTAPSGMEQAFRVEELTPPRVFRFRLLASRMFRTALLTFTLAPEGTGTRITHEVDIQLRFPLGLLGPLFRLVSKGALDTDLDALRRALDEGHDLTASEGAHP